MFNQRSATMPIQVTIGRWTVDQYLRFSRWWILAGVAVVVLTSVARLLPGTALPWNVAVFFVLGAAIARRHGGATEALTAGAIVGLAVGLASSVVKLVGEPSIISGINVIAETMVTGLIGALVATIAVIVFRLIKKQG